MGETDRDTSTQAGGHATPEQMNRQHIFVIIGSPDLLDIIRQLLQKANFNVTTMNFVPRTFETIEQAQPSLLIIDLVLGERAGWHVLARLRHAVTTRGIRVLLISHTPELLMKADDAHRQFRGDEFLLKPFDLDAGTLTIRQKLVTIADVPTFGPPKSANGARIIPIPSPVIDALRRHKTRQLEERLTAGGPWQASWQLVFCTETGSPISGPWLRKHVKTTLASAGLPDMRWHDLRHSTASILAAWDMHPKVVQAILGHGDASLTIQRYTHADLEAVRQATERLGGLLGEGGE